MELQVTGKNVELTETVHRYIEKKIGRLSRYLPGILEAKVEVAKENTRSALNRHVVQVTLTKKGATMRGEERAADLLTAIDAVANVMHRQIERYKGKHYWKGKPAQTAGETALEGEEGGRVVKVKRFPLKPMETEEATEQMELLGRNFFLFLNAATDQVSLLYRRKDGDYGLIEPEL